MDNIWYLAYGSNMSRDKFTGRRGIQPLAAVPVRVPGWSLAFDIPGVPYSEPVFTSIKAAQNPSNPQRGESSLACGSLDLLGIAYLISPKDYAWVIASEGGGVAYANFEIDGVPLKEAQNSRLDKHQAKIRMRTLVAAIERRGGARPSVRYMGLLITGAKEARLPHYYQVWLKKIESYEPPQTLWGKIGAAIFLGLWTPVMALMEWLVRQTVGSNGYAPKPVITFVRFAVRVLWLSHDFLFAPIFGRGDGLKAKEKRYEQRPRGCEKLISLDG